MSPFGEGNRPSAESKEEEGCSVKKLIHEEDLQHVIPLLELHYGISKPTEANITPQILQHIADKIQLDISNDEVAAKLRKEILELNY